MLTIAGDGELTGFIALQTSGAASAAAPLRSKARRRPLQTNGLPALDDAALTKAARGIAAGLNLPADASVTAWVEAVINVAGGQRIVLGFVVRPSPTNPLPAGFSVEAALAQTSTMAAIADGLLSAGFVAPGAVSVAQSNEAGTIVSPPVPVTREGMTGSTQQSRMHGLLVRHAEHIAVPDAARSRLQHQPRSIRQHAARVRGRRQRVCSLCLHSTQC